MKVLVVKDSSMCPDLFEFIKSSFEVVAVSEPYQALETLRASNGGFDIVISYVHYKRQKDANQAHKLIADEFQQLLPIVCSKCISEAVKWVDDEEVGIMSVSDLIIHKWLKNTKDNLCMMEWTKELNFKFFAVVESLDSSDEDATTPANILVHMIMDEPKLTTKKISSHLQKYRFFKKYGQRKNKLAKHYEEYRNLCNSQFLPEVMPSTAPPPQQINCNGTPQLDRDNNGFDEDDESWLESLMQKDQEIMINNEFLSEI